MVMVGQLFMEKIQPLWFSGPLIPTCIALVDDRLPIDDDDEEEEE